MCPEPARAGGATSWSPGYSSSCRTTSPAPAMRVHDLAEPPEPLDLLLGRGRPGQLEVRPAAIDVQLLVEVVLAPAERLGRRIARPGCSSCRRKSPPLRSADVIPLAHASRSCSQTSTPSAV